MIFNISSMFKLFSTYILTFFFVFFIKTNFSYGLGHYESVGKINVFLLKGSAREIGQQAGKLISRKAFQKGMIPISARLLEVTAMQSPVVRKNSWLKPLVPGYLNFKYYNKFESSLDKDDREMIDAMADELRFSRRWMRRAFLNPDAVHRLISDASLNRFFGSFEESKVAVQGMLRSRFEGSSFIVRPKLSGQPHTLFGRSVDGPGVGSWDQFHSIYSVERPGKYRYITIGSVGLIGGTATMMNEHGLTLAVHSGLTKHASQNGVSIRTTVRKMIEESKTIEGALKQCNANVPLSAWMIPIADVRVGKSRVARIEVVPSLSKCVVEFQDNAVITTNHLFDEDNKKDELLFGPSVEGESNDRFKQIEKLLIFSKGSFDVHKAMRMLSDNFDQRLNRRVSYPPSGIVTVNNLMAVVLIPETREVYISNGKSPAASFGRYIHFDFEELMNRRKLINRDRSKDITMKKLLKYSKAGFSGNSAFAAFRSAFMFESNQMDYRNAQKKIRSASGFEPREGLYLFLDGLLSLKHGEYDRAINIFNDLLNPVNDPKDFVNHIVSLQVQYFPLDEHRLKVVRLYLARAYDLVGKREEAKKMYRQVAEDLDAFRGLSRAAIEGLAKPFSIERRDLIEPSLKRADFDTYF